MEDPSPPEYLPIDTKSMEDFQEELNQMGALNTEKEIQYINDNAELIEAKRLEIGIRNGETTTGNILGSLFFALSELDDNRCQQFKDIEDDADFIPNFFDVTEHFIKMKKLHQFSIALVELQEYTYICEDLNLNIDPLNIFRYIHEIENQEAKIKYGSQQPRRLYNVDYVIDRRLQPIFLEMEDQNIPSYDQNRFIIAIFDHFKYFVSNENMSEKEDMVCKMRERCHQI